MAESQTWIEGNRPPRVQITYDIETFGLTKTVELPFIVGVMSDLGGKQRPDEQISAGDQSYRGTMDKRKFHDIDVDNFDGVLKSMKPRVAFPVKDTLRGEGNMSVDITFEKLEDFSPSAIAMKVEPLRKLLEARNQLDALATLLDGRDSAEKLVGELLNDKVLMEEIKTLWAANEPRQ